MDAPRSDPGLSVPRLRGHDRRRGDRDQHPGHVGLHAAGGVRRPGAHRDGARAEHRQGAPSPCTATTTWVWPRRCPWSRSRSGPSGWSAPSTGRRAGGQRLPGRDRDDAEDRADYFQAETGIARSRSGAPAAWWRSTWASRCSRTRRGGVQRLLPRLRAPPGRDAQGAHHLRDHDPGEHRAHGQPDRDLQALRAQRLPRPPEAAGLRAEQRRVPARLQGLQGAGGQEEGRHRRGRGGRRGRPGADRGGDLPPGAPPRHLRRPGPPTATVRVALPEGRSTRTPRPATARWTPSARPSTAWWTSPTGSPSSPCSPSAPGSTPWARSRCGWTSDEGTFIGRGASTDIIVASARAYLNALNKVAAARRDREAGHPHRSPSPTQAAVR